MGTSSAATIADFSGDAGEGSEGSEIEEHADTFLANFLRGRSGSFMPAT